MPRRWPGPVRGSGGIGRGADVVRSLPRATDDEGREGLRRARSIGWVRGSKVVCLRLWDRANDTKADKVGWLSILRCLLAPPQVGSPLPHHGPRLNQSEGDLIGHLTTLRDRLAGDLEYRAHHLSYPGILGHSPPARTTPLDLLSPFGTTWLCLVRLEPCMVAAFFQPWSTWLVGGEHIALRKPESPHCFVR